jgi:hypothetical protein
VRSIQATKTGLYTLVYASRARRYLPAVQSFRDILACSQMRNEQVGVTGALLSFADMFLQTLEGSRPAVQETFGRIRHDSRHHSVRVLWEGQTACRQFSGWSMCGEHVDSPGASVISELEILAGFEQSQDASLRAEDLLRVMQDFRAPHIRPALDVVGNSDVVFL